VRHCSVRNVDEVDEQALISLGVSANRKIHVCAGEKRFICNSVGSAILPGRERGLK